MIHDNVHKGVCLKTVVSVIFRPHDGRDRDDRHYELRHMGAHGAAWTRTID